ncbi:MAG: sialate O-acetylesterase [Planctomycetota bacterium]
MLLATSLGQLRPAAVLAAAVLPLPLAAQSPPSDGATTVPTFVLFGQSNMEGYACSLELPSHLQGQLSGVMIWNFCPGVDAWEPLTAGLNTNVDPGATFCEGNGLVGPEAALGSALQAHLGETVYLMKYGVGGTWLAPPAFDGTGAPCPDAPPCTGTGGPHNASTSWDPTCGDLYGELLAQLDAANAALSGATLDVRGIFCAQGAWDGVSACLADPYAANLTDLIATLRGDIQARGLTSLTTIPFIVGQTPDYVAYTSGILRPAIDTVRTAQREVVCADAAAGLFDGSDASFRELGSTDGCGQPGDGLHFDGAGQAVHGEGLFQAYLDQACPSLSADTSYISMALGGSQVIDFRSQDPASQAGLYFRLLGSSSGTAGFTWVGVHVPLTIDDYLVDTLGVTPTYLTGSQGTLPGSAEASVTLSVPATASFVGLRLHHAMTLYDPGPAFPDMSFASGPVGVNLTY